MATSVLVSGGGIAGPTLAYWLQRFGFEPTIVERSPAPRTGGQAVDISGAALDVIAAMGLLGEAQGLRTQLKGMPNG